MNGQLLDFTDVDPSMAGAAGGSALVTTAPDLARFLDAVLAGELFQKSGSLDEMLAFVDAPDEAGVPYWYGLGVERYVLPGGVEMIGHAGGTAGYASAVHYLPAQDITVGATMNIEDLGSFYLQLLLPALEMLIPEFSMPEQPEPAGTVYEDPEGRFSLPLIGDWTQVETDGSYAQFAFAEPPLDMVVVTAESDDLEAGVEAALKQIGIDPATLTLTQAGNTMGLWFVFFYSAGDGQGVAVLAQVRDGTTWAIVATGDEDVVVRAEPPGDVLDTIEGFAFAGEKAALW
jgi:hypothetical protein